jgi:hypothetical protein
MVLFFDDGDLVNLVGGIPEAASLNRKFRLSHRMERDTEMANK